MPSYNIEHRSIYQARVQETTSMQWIVYSLYLHYYLTFLAKTTAYYVFFPKDSCNLF